GAGRRAGDISRESWGGGGPQGWQRSSQAGTGWEQSQDWMRSQDWDTGEGRWSQGSSERQGSRGQSQETARGQNRGRGPKGWQRSDERIREDVCERMANDPQLDASNIEVDVKNGEVT